MNTSPPVVIIGGGPAGLMAADRLSEAGLPVALFEAQATLGRKFLMAGRGGLNITHSEPTDRFLAHYGSSRERLAPWIGRFGPEAIRAWMADLGEESFVGSSGRVFPRTLKASPLLRAWIRRLANRGVAFHVRHRWLGWARDGAAHRFAMPEGDILVQASATLLALGGASWPRLGSDGAWTGPLAELDLPLAPFQPANCGFNRPWSPILVERFAGTPVKPVSLSFNGVSRRGEFILTRHGVEGGVIYAFSAALRDAIATRGEAIPHLDLVPDRSFETLATDLARPRGGKSLATHLKRRGIPAVAGGLVRELAPDSLNSPAALARSLKALPLPLVSPRPLTEAISTAGGLSLAALDDGLMVRDRPGLFCCGEMLDWEAPTGGYLLTACLAQGRAAAEGVIRWRTTGPCPESS
ncbi:MAG: TIGR03862 family flavoprotein [Rhodospirillum sp.]|nr:TIGR03862 family flavoprotein [Rhodospirillum sp.]MCF8488966.1 TIGR03862 family flavoprotein [Rhodospirillum sp.]MCF8500007.1 TIGR03862 family flavoprotein [Rhodospirillum sp.]